MIFLAIAVGPLTPAPAMAEVFKESGPAVVSSFGPLKTLSISDPMMIKKLGAWAHQWAQKNIL